MSQANKTTLKIANGSISKGDHEGFLEHCTEDTHWHFVGDKTLHGKQAVREWMASEYKEPPNFKVEHLIAEGDFVVAIGTIKLKEEDYNYCDVWQFRDGKMAALKAFVTKDSNPV